MVEYLIRLWDITSQLPGGVYLFTKMNFGDHQFNILKLEQVEDSDADGLYIDSAEDRYCSLVKDGRILLSFESVD